VTTSITIEKDIHLARLPRGRQELRAGAEPRQTSRSLERIPRLARLMALAIRFENLLQIGTIRDQAELARLGQVSRARVSQILALLHLAPDIQEEILFLQGGGRGSDLLLADVRPICTLTDWNKQRRGWRALRRKER
jgi:hypothetical protein